MDDEMMKIITWEALKPPTEEAIKRNKDALALLRKVQGKELSKMSHGEQKLIELFAELSQNPTNDAYTFGVLDGIKDTLTLLGIKIEGINVV